MTLKELGNLISEEIENGSEILKVEENIFFIQKIREDKFLIKRKDSKTEIEIYLSRKKITSILISKNGFKKSEDGVLGKYPVINVLWDIDKSFGWRRFEENFDFYEDDDDAQILVSDFLL